MSSKEDNLLAAYHELKPHLETWGKVLVNAIGDLITQNYSKEFIKIPIGYRIKSDSSIIAKAFFRKKPYKEPLKEIEDKIGCRIVLLRSQDVYSLADLIENETDLAVFKRTKDIKNLKEINPKEFDYQSVHIIARPNDSYEQFKHMDVTLLTCEIQIRTLLQHAFAEVSHDSTYKGPYKHDHEILRSLSKSMALMETTDDCFFNISTLMADEGRRFPIYKKGLDNLYVSLGLKMPDYYDLDLLETTFALFNMHEVDFATLETFINKDQGVIASSIEKSSSLLFTQPVILLLYYYLVNHREELKSSIELNSEALKSLFSDFGYAYDDY